MGVVAAIIVMLGLAKSYAPHLLGLGATVIVILNATQPPFSGFVEKIVLTFIGVSVFLLLRWAQVKYIETGLEVIKRTPPSIFVGGARFCSPWLAWPLSIGRGVKLIPRNMRL